MNVSMNTSQYYLLLVSECHLLNRVKVESKTNLNLIYVQSNYSHAVWGSICTCYIWRLGSKMIEG